MVTDSVRSALPSIRSLLAVCAHPDDESFGMGAVISTFVERRARVAVLSFTHGEASTLHGVTGDLGSIRAAEFACAGRRLGVHTTELLDYPDGDLSTQPLEELVVHVLRVRQAVEADTLLVFDVGGITGHLDHVRATQAALAAAELADLAVLAWALPATVATQLNTEFSTAFVGCHDEDLHHVVRVDRRCHRAAIAEHASQSISNPVLWRRLELLGDEESLRWLRHPQGRSATSTTVASPATPVTDAVR